jgi:S1-C subfamily serine protease
MSQPMSPSPLEGLSAALAGRVAATAPSVVSIRMGRGTASGFVWRPGLVVTAEEALPEEGEPQLILPGGAVVRATLAGRDPTTDIALLRLEGEGPAPVALHPEPPPPGALVQVVGAQEGRPIAALGAVAALGPAWRSLRGGEIDARVDLDLSLRGAAEGGLALDAAGRAFGMAVFGPRRRVLVIPAATIERVAPTLAAKGRVARGYLGLKLQPVALDGEAGMGAMVMGVEEGGPGAAAGLRQGDVILAWEGRPIEGVRGLLRALGPASVGSRVRLALKRAGGRTEVDLTIGERPQG